MAVFLNRNYAGFLAGTVQQFSAELEAALISGGGANASTAGVTPGAQSNTLGSDYPITGISGVAAIPAGASSVAITNPRINAGSKVFAAITQAAADGTLLAVARVSIVGNTATIHGNANATAAVQVGYLIVQ